MSTFNGFDLFGIPLEYASESARKKRWASYISTLSNLTKTDISCTFKCSIYDIYNCVFLGFLSFQSASYFLLGRFTPSQDEYLRTFCDFLTSSEGMSISKIKALWLGKNQPVPASLFASPLVAPASNLDALMDFTQERTEYYKDYQPLLTRLQNRMFIDQFEDLPPLDAEMPSTY